MTERKVYKLRESCTGFVQLEGPAFFVLAIYCVVQFANETG